jgi:hypothetical protein
MNFPRYRYTIFYPPRGKTPGVVEVRSRPLWVTVLEFWFLWIHEFFSHTLNIRLPEDPYWGEPFEAGFHKFYSWSINYDEVIEESATITKHKKERVVPT